MANITAKITLDVLSVLELDADPTTGGGTSAEIGSIALDASDGELWCKVGPLDSDWRVVVTNGGSGAVQSVNGKNGIVILTKNDIGLSNVDNTADLNKPISNAMQAALDKKVSIVQLAIVVIILIILDIVIK